jgi:signal transduction histidine kinase
VAPPTSVSLVALEAQAATSSPRAGFNGPLRRRVRLAIVAATAAALVVFAVPLMIAIRSAYVQQSETELEREAGRVLAVVSNDEILSSNVLPRPTDPDITLAVYDTAGRRTDGQGPAFSRMARSSSATGEARTVRGGSSLVALLPVGVDGAPQAVVRAALPSTVVAGRYLRAWALMGLLALVVLMLAWWASGRLARRLSAPLERLAASAESLGRGGFALRVPRSGVSEVDVVAAVLEESGRRLGDRFQRERAFSADASHQLRTPITALRVTLESAQVDPASSVEAVSTEALVQVDRLERTVEDLLALSRDLPGPAAPVAVGPVVEGLGDRYRGACLACGRELSVTVVGELPLAAFPEAALRQVLDVLVDNALEHGSGEVGIVARASGTGVAVDVRDEGLLPGGDLEEIFLRRSASARGTGIGLALARSLAEAEGARLLAANDEAGTVFTLLMAEALSHA